MTRMGEKFAIPEKLARSYGNNFTNLRGFLDHSLATGETAGELAQRLGLNVVEAFLAGYFHDVERCFTADHRNHTFHEIVGARYLEKNGVELGIASTQQQADRLAQSVRSHFVVYEQFTMLEYHDWLPGLRDTNPSLLLPRSWNEIVVVYADLTNIDGKKTTFNERLEDIKVKDKERSNLRFHALEAAESRLLALGSDVEEALSRRMTGDKYIYL